jgi:hypothetical protein
MTPKEKAGELYFKYHNLWINGNSMIAKQCALIAVDEILNYDNQFIQTEEQFNYWKEVKQELLEIYKKEKGL